MATTLNLIAIPNGITDAGTLGVSIVVAPRLSGGRRLGRFDDMLDWTASLAAGPPRVRLRFGNAVVAAQADTTLLRPNLWQALFDEATPVEPFEFDDASNDVVVSYRTRDALAIVKGAYQKAIADSPGAIPTAMASARQLDVLSLPQGDHLTEMLSQHRLQLWRRRDERASHGGGPQPVQETVKDFTLFYRMPQPDPRAPDPLPRTDEALSELLDFHGAVTALSSHPTLMRALGLVIDVTVAAADVAASGAHGLPLATVSVEEFEPSQRFRDTTFLTPGVLYRHHPASAGLRPVFSTAEPTANGEIVEGFLGLDERQFHLLDLDVDGALAKLTGLATALPRMFQSPTADGALPALRGAGISLAVHDRGREVVNALRRAAQLNAAITAGPGGAAVPLTARDLVRGYRVDVWSSAINQWRSLHRREATYTFGASGSVQLAAEEEGFSQFATASPVPDPTRAAQPGPPIETDKYVHEALARWTGWSLSAPRPGKPIHRSDEHNPLKDDDTTDALVTAFHMRQAFVPSPGSLPALRFGHRYRMRVRVVDIGGNSPAATESEAVPVAAPGHPVVLPPAPESQPYFRYEPVPHPLLVLRSLPAATRSALDRLIIRSFNSDPSLDAVATTDIDERHVAPPRASVDLAERHGMLDDAAGKLKGDAATFASIVARNDAAFATAPVGAPPRDVPIDPAARLTVDYLPDPLARAAAFRFLPGVARGRVAFAGIGGLAERKNDPDREAGPVVQVRFGDLWPDREALRFTIRDGNGEPSWDANTRVLTAFVPKGTTTEVRLSSALGDADLELMGVWAWQREYLEQLAQAIVSSAGGGLAASLEEHARLSAVLLRLALEGGQWALTPSIPVQLIHAVQQPIGRPRFACGDRASVLAPVRGAPRRIGRRADPAAPLVAMRAYGSPDATLVGGLHVHLASTGRVDLIASWSDIADDAASAEGFVRTAARGTLEPIKLDRTTGAIKAEGAARRHVAHVIGDDRLGFLPDRYEGSTLQPPAAPIHQFGDTRHRRVTYTAIVTSRFQADFPQNQNLVFTRESEPVTVSLPNSAKPAAPRIVQVLPTFGWRREQSGTLRSSIRYGRGLRIYLDRPWFTSGEGELLGVVLWRAGTSPPDRLTRRDRLAGLVTEWGLDPLRPSGALTPMPGIADLTGAQLAMTDVDLPEAGMKADIAGYAVHTDGGLWYADVTLAAEEAYMPFVRLALVRFQPESIPGAEISAVASAGFMQLTPDRSAVLIADPSLPRLYHLVVSGVAPTPSPAIPWRNAIEVSVEERRDDVEGDLGWQPIAGGVAKVTPVAAAPSAPSVLFSGLIEFAAQPVPGRYRIVIREYETWQVDPAPRILGLLDRIETRAATAASLAAVKIQGGAAGGRAAAPPPAAAGAAREDQFLVTARAFERLGAVITGPPTGRRLVYAEFVAVDPPAPSKDLSLAVAGPDGEVIGEPGVGLGDGDPEDPPRPWPAQPGTSPLGFEPHWENVPAVGPSLNPTVVSAPLKLAQAMLNTAIGLQPPLAIDGLFGPITEAAIRAMRAATMLPNAGGLDAQGWLALATIAPFPVLEPGLRNPPMAGPPIALVQRLLNMTRTTNLLSEDGVFTPATAAGVRAFQSDRGLAQTGTVDLATWLELANLFDMVHPTGAERVVLGFDRARAAGGGPALVLLDRDPLADAAVPASETVDESWSGRTGLWVELQDTRGQVLFRQRLGQELTRPPEAPPDAASGDLVGRPGAAPADTTLSVILPIVPAARRFVVFGTFDEGDHGPASPIAVFEPW